MTATVPVGGSLRRSLGGALALVASGWSICEVVPESWDPEAAADRELLEQLAARTSIALHSLSLNPLGDGPSEAALRRITRWRQLLRRDVVSDHFAWVGWGHDRPGVFLPPVEPPSQMALRIERVRERVGCDLVLENVALSARAGDAVLAYHDALRETCALAAVPILLDLENLRLDALVSGLTLARLVDDYAGAAIHGYHVAGSEVLGGLAFDTHRREIDDATLALLPGVLARAPAPIIYERDQALDAALIAAEVERLRGAVELDR